MAGVFKVRDTVATDTPANSATLRILVIPGCEPPRLVAYLGTIMRASLLHHCPWLIGAPARAPAT
ncbi:hypothetical protein GCM10027512_02060 [Chromohalobacter beijerinckii]